MKKGFTLIEMLVVVLIVAILTGVALPKYMRSLERARATEAMANVKVFNEAIYTYAAGRDGECPIAFSKLPMSIAAAPGDQPDKRTTKNFQYTLGGAVTAPVPGTNCKGVIATRLAAPRYKYVIWNPFTPGARSLACFGYTEADKDLCLSLGVQTGDHLNPFN